MARQESDREDLLREATALVERAELTISDCDEPAVVGFRRDGSASLFFGADPVYQLNSQGKLRRAYVAGKLIKAEAGKLASLDRRREADRVVLARHDLDENETADFVSEMIVRLSALRTSLAAGRFKVTGQVPADANVIGRIRDWLNNLGEPIPIAHSPRANGG
jgi:hypothetical protein